MEIINLVHLYISLLLPRATFASQYTPTYTTVFCEEEKESFSIPKQKGKVIFLLLFVTIVLLLALCTHILSAQPAESGKCKQFKRQVQFVQRLAFRSGVGRLKAIGFYSMYSIYYILYCNRNYTW